MISQNRRLTMKDNQAKYPQLRFKGFTDPWEQRKLGDLADFNPKSVLPETFEYVDLESVVGTDIISHRLEHKDSAPSRAQRLAQKGDVFYQTVRPYQKNNCIFDKLDNDWVFSTGYAQLRPKKDSYFLLVLLQNNSFMRKVLGRCTGTSYPAINSKDLAQIKVSISDSIDEQKKIGNLFRNIDNTIALHQRKLAKLKELKQGYLQKLFPKNGSKFPQLRFAGFADAWEQRKLGEIVEINSGRDYKKLGRGKIPVFGTGGYMLSVNGKLSDRDSVGIGRKGSIDKPQFLSAPFWTVDTLFFMTPKNKNDAKFIFDLSQLIQWKKYDESTGVPSLSKSTISNIPITVTKEDEQNKVSTLFELVDKIIAANQRKVEKLKELKKGYMQKMFC
ncbi:restriction endonuclease subunit S [Lactobacillus acetotolerans]|uniref:restriction endonuclease subunit S n=1 Tax=Lactobacillus acetotolerans TaxID=1600 RepID=UPI0012E92463|nr:restriction endonuclease subunit S [Lactobacillus acetotolerans]